jgi:hypothetical protein
MNPMPPVVGTAELSDRWGITPSAAGQVADRDGFPKPEILRQGRVWLLADVEMWEQDRIAAGLPLPGQRPRGPEPQGGR